MTVPIESLATPVRRVYANGLTLLHQAIPHRASIALGVWLRAGARDEPADHAGATHFLEHMLFKGTEKRNAYDISASLESLGGHLDAFTAREHVCYYGRALEEHLPQTLDVLADVVGHSTLPDDEIEREKEVVREEIFSYEDSPEEKVHDLLSEALWGADPLGRPILGTEASVNAFTGDALRAFYRGRYHPGNLVIALSGSFDAAWAEEMIGQAFAQPAGAPLALATTQETPVPRATYGARDVSQLHLALARPALPHDSPERYRLAVLATIVGGGMSSRLFQTMREQRGLAYSVYASTESFRDTGMVSIALGVKPARGAEALEALRTELARFVKDGPTDEEIDSGKAQMRGSLLLGEESVSNHMYHLALDELAYGRFIPLATHLDEVARVTRVDLMDLARRFFTPDHWALAAVGPEASRTAVLAAAEALGATR